MATNTNTSNNSTSTSDVILSTDFYEIYDFVDSMRRNNVDDVNDTAAVTGIFGYLNENFAQSLQNTLIAISESTNETIPTRAKFSKNIITHAMNLGITKIYATPACMTLMIYLPLKYVEANMSETAGSTKAKFVFDKDIPIYIGEYEYHVDYDIVINKVIRDKVSYYTAMYDLFDGTNSKTKRLNPISNISNPYINTLAKYKIDNVEYLMFSVKVHQVANEYITKDILTNTTIENKTITFSFDDQLAAFDIDVEENNKTTHLTPIYAGLIDYSVDDGNWCYYEYLDENTIRIKFDNDSYVPGMNATVRVNIKRTEGSAGNITYTETFRQGLKSEKNNNYNGMYMIITPLQNGVSNGGKDKKSIKELKKIIPREASSRGSIINTTDLINFFNSINDTDCRLYFEKKRDNPFERLYYAHMLMRKNSCVYPTNTLNVKIYQDNFHGNAKNNNLSISPGTVFYYYDHGSDTANDFCTIRKEDIEFIEIEDNDNPQIKYTTNVNGDVVRVFEYISPFLITIDEDLITSYLLTIVKNNKTFGFDSINTSADLQFVATNMDWNRKFIYTDSKGNTQVYDNKYTMDVSITQNNNLDYGLIKFQYDGNGDMVFNDIRVKMFMVLYSDETDSTPYRYIEADLQKYDPIAFVYDFRFTLETDDYMDLNNRINIKNIRNAKPEAFQSLDEIPDSHGYMNKNTFARIYILADFGTKVGDVLEDGTTATTDTILLYGEDGNGNKTDFEKIIPTKEDIINQFLSNNIQIEKDSLINVVNIIKGNEDYLEVIKKYNENTIYAEKETQKAILNYLNANKNSDFVQNTLLQDPLSIEVINNYNFENLSRYTLCNTFTVDDGIDFYYDYSEIMSSNVSVQQIQKTTESGDLLYYQTDHIDSLGTPYKEMIPIYETNDNGDPIYNYTIKRIPMIKNGFLFTENRMKDFIYDLEERRKYIKECLEVLEDTFGIDLKFFNTYGPSRRFYYEEPNASSYKAKVVVTKANILANITGNEDDENNIVASLYNGESVMIEKVRGQWGRITIAINGGYVTGWIKLSNVSRVATYIDNVSLSMKFAMQTQSSADKSCANNIVLDIKDYIEDINEITELHSPNIITLITNNYREQLVYFEFLDINGYGSGCQHLYLDTNDDVEITPEFLNISTKEDGTDLPDINITVY